MPGSVRLRQDYSSSELRRLASRSKDANQSQRLLSLAAVLDGMSRADAARIGGIGRRDASGLGASVQPRRLASESAPATSELLDAFF